MNSKKKGKTGELEFSRLCRSEGYETHRTAQYCGNTGEAADIQGLPYVHVEIKRVEKLNIHEAMRQSIHDAHTSAAIPIVAHRRNNDEWLVTMRATDWFALYREWETSKTLSLPQRCERQGG